MLALCASITLAASALTSILPAVACVACVIGVTSRGRPMHLTRPAANPVVAHVTTHRQERHPNRKTPRYYTLRTAVYAECWPESEHRTSLPAHAVSPLKLWHPPYSTPSTPSTDPCRSSGSSSSERAKLLFTGYTASQHVLLLRCTTGRAHQDDRTIRLTGNTCSLRDQIIKRG